MNWLLPALLSPAIYAVNIFIDKYLLEREIQDYKGMPIFTSIIGFITGTVFWVATGMPLVEFSSIFIVIISGILTIFGYAFYFKALTSKHASSINLFLQTYPLIVLILSFLFLGEHLNLKQFIGFLFVIAAAIPVAVEGESSKIKISSSFWLILLVNLFAGIAAIIVKFALGISTFTEIVSYESWGIGIGGILLYFCFLDVRKGFMKNIKKISAHGLGIIIINEVLFILARLLSYFAFISGPVSLVSVLSVTQVFYGFLYGWVLTLTFPKVFKENITAKNLIKNLVLSIFVLFGIWLVS